MFVPTDRSLLLPYPRRPTISPSQSRAPTSTKDYILRNLRFIVSRRRRVERQGAAFRHEQLFSRRTAKHHRHRRKTSVFGIFTIIVFHSAAGLLRPTTLLACSIVRRRHEGDTPPSARVYAGSSAEKARNRERRERDRDREIVLCAKQTHVKNLRKLRHTAHFKEHGQGPIIRVYLALGSGQQQTFACVGYQTSSRS